MAYFIDESYSDSDYTAAGSVGGVFGTPRQYLSITIHHWGVFGQTHMGVVNFFMRPNSPTSAHFVVSDGLIHCLVSPQDASWASGNAYGNATSIHIEARPEATDGDYATVAWLVAYLRRHYGDLPLKPHNYWALTACPGNWDLDRVDREARGALVAPAASERPVPITPTKPTPPKEAPLSASEVDKILNAVGDKATEVKKYVADVMIYGYATGGRNFPGVGMVVMENQRRLNAQMAALEGVVEQLAKGQGVAIDYDKIAEVVDKSLADGIEISGTIIAKE